MQKWVLNEPNTVDLKYIKQTVVEMQEEINPKLYLF